MVGMVRWPNTCLLCTGDTGDYSVLEDLFDCREVYCAMKRGK